MTGTKSTKVYFVEKGKETRKNDKSTDGFDWAIGLTILLMIGVLVFFVFIMIKTDNDLDEFFQKSHVERVNNQSIIIFKDQSWIKIQDRWIDMETDEKADRTTTWRLNTKLKKQDFSQEYLKAKSTYKKQ